MAKKGWSKDPRELTIDVMGDVDAVMQEAALRVLRTLTVRSPVDTGRFKGNWQVNIGSKKQGALTTTDKAGGRTLSVGASVINTHNDQKPIFISNNLPYADRLNQGHSKQAPRNFVEMSVAFAERTMSK